MGASAVESMPLSILMISASNVARNIKFAISEQRSWRNVLTPAPIGMWCSYSTRLPEFTQILGWSLIFSNCAALIMGTWSATPSFLFLGISFVCKITLKCTVRYYSQNDNNSELNYNNAPTAKADKCYGFPD